MRQCWAHPWLSSSFGPWPVRDKTTVVMLGIVCDRESAPSVPGNFEKLSPNGNL